MIVPIDLLKPIFDDLLTLGRPGHPPRPWLGLYATEIANRIVVVNLASRGPASDADLRSGDVVLNGPAARLVQPGDRVIILSWGEYDDAELADFRPRVVLVDDRNRPRTEPDEGPHLKRA